MKQKAKLRMKEIIKYQTLKKTIKFTTKQLKYINSLGSLKGNEWEISTNEMNEIKAFIKSQLDKLQDGYCIYCGRHKEFLGEHLERDHIAPKNSRKYPNFMFEPLNLVLACHGCNGSSKKGQNNTITVYNINYSKCSFNIVHPYFDDFLDHIIYAKEENSIILKHKTDKGERTIDMFDLNNTMLAYIRGKDINLGKYKLSKVDENKVDAVITRIYST